MIITDLPRWTINRASTGRDSTGELWTKIFNEHPKIKEKELFKVVLEVQIDFYRHAIIIQKSVVKFCEENEIEGLTIRNISNLTIILQSLSDASLVSLFLSGFEEVKSKELYQFVVY